MKMFGKEKRIAALLYCALMMVIVSFEWRHATLAANPSVRHAQPSTRSSSDVSGPKPGCKAASACDNYDTSTVFLAAKSSWPCLQNNIRPEDVVSLAMSKTGTGPDRKARVTVDQTLKRLKARCRKGRLVDADGKELYFYRLAGCWGNPPADYQEILQRQSEELQKLKRHYHVIEMTCNASAEQIQ